MRETGAKHRDIALAVGMKISSVEWYCLKFGAYSPLQPIRNTSKSQPGIIIRGNHIVRRYSPEDDRKLLELESEGLRLCDIARALGRQANSVKNRLSTLARRDERRVLDGREWNEFPS